MPSLITTMNVFVSGSIVWHKSAFDMDYFPWPSSEVNICASMSIHWPWNSICRSTVNTSSFWYRIPIDVECSSRLFLYEDVLVSGCTPCTLQPSCNFLCQYLCLDMRMRSIRLSSLYIDAVRRSTGQLAILFLIQTRTIRIDHRVHWNQGSSSMSILLGAQQRWKCFSVVIFITEVSPRWARIIGISCDWMLIWISTMLQSLLFVIYSSLLIVVLIMEALFITPAQTQLNTLGHLDGMVVKDDTH